MVNRLCLTVFVLLSFLSAVQAQEKHTTSQLTENVSEDVNNVNGTLTAVKTIEVQYARTKSLEKTYQLEAKKGDGVTIQANSPELQDLRFAFCPKTQRCQPVCYHELTLQQVVQESGIYLLRVNAPEGRAGQGYYHIVLSVAHGPSH